MMHRNFLKNKIYRNVNQLILRNIVSLLIGQGSLLLLFFIALTPLISYIYQLTLKFTGFSHVTIDNLKKFLFNPVSIFMLLFLLCLIGIFLLFEIYFLTIFFGQVEQYKKVRILWVIQHAIYKLAIDLVKGNIGLIPDAFSMLSIFNLPVFFFILYKTRSMRYFASELSNLIIGVTLTVLIASLVYLMLFRKAFLFQNHLLGDMTCKEASKYGKDISKNHILRVFFYFLGWNIILFLVIAVLYLFLMGIMILLSSCLFNKQLAIATFLYLTENMKSYLITFIFLICTIGNLALYTHLFYFFQMNTKGSEKKPENDSFAKGINSISIRGKSFHKILLIVLLVLAIINLYSFIKILRNGSPLEYMNLDKIEVTSHRGFSYDVPENTLPAIEKAIEAKSDYVEVDVRLTKDGIPVLLHDSNLERTTGVNKYIWQVTYEELTKLDAGKWEGKRYAGTRIPTLQEVLENCKGRIHVNLDLKYHPLKDNLAKKATELIDDYEMEWQCVISSTSLSYLEQVKELNPNIQTGYISYQLYPDLLENDAVDFFSMKSNLITKNILQRIHKNGKKLVVWTVNSKTELERLERIGVDNIITDNPSYAREVLYETETEGYFITLLKIMKE